MAEEFRPAKQLIPVLFRGRIVPGVFGEIQTLHFVPADNPENARIVLDTTRRHWRELDYNIQRAIRHLPSVSMRATIALAPQQNFARYGFMIYHAIGDEHYLPEDFGFIDSSCNAIPSELQVWTDDEDHIPIGPGDMPDSSDDEDEEMHQHPDTESDTDSGSVSTDTGEFLTRVLQHALSRYDEAQS